jgi:hypothetical protein
MTVLWRKEWTRELKERHKTMTGINKNRLEWKRNT